MADDTSNNVSEFPGSEEALNERRQQTSATLGAGNFLCSVFPGTGESGHAYLSMRVTNPFDEKESKVLLTLSDMANHPDSTDTPSAIVGSRDLRRLACALDSMANMLDGFYV